MFEGKPTKRIFLENCWLALKGELHKVQTQWEVWTGLTILSFHLVLALYWISIKHLVSFLWTTLNVIWSDPKCVFNYVVASRTEQCQNAFESPFPPESNLRLWFEGKAVRKVTILPKYRSYTFYIWFFMLILLKIIWGVWWPWSHRSWPVAPRAGCGAWDVVRGPGPRGRPHPDTTTTLKQGKWLEFRAHDVGSERVTVADCANSDPAVVRSGWVKAVVTNAVHQEVKSLWALEGSPVPAVESLSGLREPCAVTDSTEEMDAQAGENRL